MSVGRVGGLIHRLLTEELGYRRYGLRASDLGAGVATRIALAHPEAPIGLHSRPPTPSSPRSPTTSPRPNGGSWPEPRRGGNPRWPTPWCTRPSHRPWRSGSTTPWPGWPPGSSRSSRPGATAAAMSMGLRPRRPAHQPHHLPGHPDDRLLGPALLRVNAGRCRPGPPRRPHRHGHAPADLFPTPGSGSSAGPASTAGPSSPAADTSPSGKSPTSSPMTSARSSVRCARRDDPPTESASSKPQRGRLEVGDLDQARGGSCLRSLVCRSAGSALPSTCRRRGTAKVAYGGGIAWLHPAS